VNHVLEAAAATAGLGSLLGVMTAIFLVSFAGWTLWAYHPSRRAEMDANANLPFEDDPR
jgi:cbb3-type cytochrome oxidase subunit 3